MGCRLSSSARHEPQVRGQRRSTQGGFTSKTGFGDVANFVPVSLDIRSDRYSTGPPGELIQTNGQPACPEDGVLHADVSRRDSVVLCFKPSCITANSRAASPWFTIPSRSHMLSNFEWRFLWDVREYDMLRCSLYLECRRTPLKQQKFCVDVCHNFELRGAEICFSFALITLEEVMTEKQRRRIISSRSSPKLQLQNVQKTHKNWSPCNAHPKERNARCLAYLTTYRRLTSRCICCDCNCPMLGTSFTASKEVKLVTAHHFFHAPVKETVSCTKSTFEGTSQIWGARNFLSRQDISGFFQTQSVLQDAETADTMSRIGAELGTKILVELNFHDVKIDDSSFECSPVPSRCHFDENILRHGIRDYFHTSQTKSSWRSFKDNNLRRRSSWMNLICLSKPGNPHFFCDAMHGRSRVHGLLPLFDTLRCSVQNLSDHPPLLVLENFLSPEDCDTLITVAAPELRRSRVTDGKLSNGRTSSSAFLTGHANEPIVMDLEDRIIAAVCMVGRIVDSHRSRKGMQSLLPSHLISAEPFQVVHYSPGQSYTSHFDNKMGCVRRACTFMAYLSDVESGGATHFPKAVAAGTQQEGIKIMPKKGRALIFWSIVDGREDPHSLHEAETVERGSKWIVTKWLQIDQALGTLPMKRTEL